ncbi:hypothetical protein ACN9M0_05315 [Streptomyces sp. R-07]|uniref:hypothetical protein n=1 Tax=unclassified Streptomyces TaxID=2593676 RepID=UPI003423D7EC
MGISMRGIGQRVMGAAAVAIAVGIFAAGGAEAASSPEAATADVSVGVRIDLGGIGAAVTDCIPGDDRWT